MAAANQAAETNGTPGGARQRSDLQKKLDRELVEAVLSRDKQPAAIPETARPRASAEPKEEKPQPVSAGAAAYKPNVKGTASVSPNGNNASTSVMKPKSGLPAVESGTEEFTERVDATPDPEVDRAQELIAKIAEQKRLRRILMECSAILAVNHEFLRLEGYPDNLTVAKATQIRDIWVTCMAVCGCIGLAGFSGWVPAWLAGSGFGLLCLMALFWIGPIRHLIFKGSTLRELLAVRKQLEFRAFNHIRLIEGDAGLAWRFNEMEPYNSQLNRRLYKGLMNASRKSYLLSLMKSRKHILLYQQFVMEAEKAYQRAQKEYMKVHFSLLDQGALDNEPTLMSGLP
ncbi:MAG: hypothetical protein H7A00_09370 [Hahellaceae bacterium]|nr:hypothetical protein [Hahellaceae bacterium]